MAIGPRRAANRTQTGQLMGWLGDIANRNSSHSHGHPPFSSQPTQPVLCLCFRQWCGCESGGRRCRRLMMSRHLNKKSEASLQRLETISNLSSHRYHHSHVQQSLPIEAKIIINIKLTRQSTSPKAPKTTRAAR